MESTCTRGHVGSTAFSEISEMSAKVSGPILSRCFCLRDAPAKPLNTSTRLIAVAHLTMAMRRCWGGVANCGMVWRAVFGSHCGAVK